MTSIPEEIGRLSKLKVLNLSSNLLRNLPYSICKLKELQALWLSENQVNIDRKIITNLLKKQTLNNYFYKDETIDSFTTREGQKR